MIVGSKSFQRRISKVNVLEGRAMIRMIIALDLVGLKIRIIAKMLTFWYMKRPLRNRLNWFLVTRRK